MAEGLNDKTGWGQLVIAVPPELMEIGVAPDLQRMFDAMIYKLRRNAHKGRWEEVPLDRAFSGLLREAEELRDAVACGSTSEILMEAADVANQALIVANIGLEAREQNEQVRGVLVASVRVPSGGSAKVGPSGAAQAMADEGR